MCAKKKVQETMHKLLEPFSEEMKDDDAALIRKIRPSDTRAWETLIG